MKQIINNKKKLINIINKLLDNNHEVYFVGGCVRDYLLGQVIHDVDLTTSATPSEMIELFEKDYKLNLSGLKHGTVSIICDKEMIEITTFRTEGGYLDTRHPDSVKFVKNIYEDLLRRDFTINAMAINAKGDEEEVLDYFNGLSDLKNGIIRTVNNSEVRLTEDALRILRALRFSSRLGFSIEEETKKSIFKHYNLLDHISKERIIDEIKRMMEGKFFKDIFKEYYQIFSYLFKLDDERIDIDLIYNNIDNLNKFNNKLSLILYYSLDPLKVIKDLRFSNAIHSNISNVLKLIDCNVNNDYDIRNILRNYSDTDTYDFLLLKGIIEYRDYNKYIDLYNENVNKCNRIKKLDIDGNDLKRIGIFSKKIGRVLNKLLDLVIKDEIANEKEILEQKALELTKSVIYKNENN